MYVTDCSLKYIVDKNPFLFTYLTVIMFNLLVIFLMSESIRHLNDDILM